MDSELCKKCKYVSLTGIIHSCDVQIRNISHAISANLSFPTITSSKVVVHVKSELLGIFFRRINAGELTRNIVLVSGNYVDTIHNDVFDSYKQLKTFLDKNSNIIKWFAQNYFGCNHPKIKHLPIGLDYHSINAAWMVDPTKNALQRELELENVRKKYAKTLNDRQLKIYITFHFEKDRRYVDRNAAITEIPSDLIHYEPDPILRLQSWINQCDYAFVAFPHCNGSDTHKIWEALLLGSIPILKSSGLDNLFEKLPVLIVHNWGDITENLLRNTVKQIVARSYLERTRSDETLLLSFWIKKFNES